MCLHTDTCSGHRTPLAYVQGTQIGVGRNDCGEGKIRGEVSAEAAFRRPGADTLRGVPGQAA